MNKRTYTLNLLVSLLIITSFSLPISAQDKAAKWDTEKLEGFNYDKANDILTKSKPSSWKNSGAFSKNILKRGIDGYVKYTMSDVTEHYILGLTSYPHKGFTYQKIDYALFISQQSIMIMEYGKIIGVYGSVNQGDQFYIQRLGNQIQYLKNNILLHSTPTKNSYDLYVYASVYESGKNIVGITTNFDPALKISPTIQNTAANNATGSITLNITGGAIPYTVNWADGDTSINRTNLTAGNYEVIVTDANGQKRRQRIPIANTVTWTNIAGASYDSTTHTLSRSTLVESYSYGNSGAMSTTALLSNQNGSLSHTIEHEGFKLIGLTDKKEGYLLQEPSYAIYYRVGSLIAVFEKGIYKKYLGKCKLGDQFTIKRLNDKIQYYHNGILLYTSTTDASQQLQPVVIFHKFGSKISNVTTSFSTEPINGNPTLQHLTNNQQGSITLNPTGGIPPYTYLWKDGSTTANRTNLSTGEYTVTITDASHHHYSETIAIANEVEWIKKAEVTHDPTTNTLARIPTGFSYGNSGATGSKALLSNQDGFLTHTLAHTGYTLLGLKESTGNYQLEDPNYAIYYRVGSTVTIYEKGIFKKRLGYCKLGDELTLKRSGNEMQYLQNGILLHTSIIDTSEQLQPVVIFHKFGSKISNVTTSFSTEPINGNPTLQHLTNNQQGSITLSPTGGTPPYTYLWKDGSTAANRTNLSTGEYTVTITDANSKTHQETIPIHFETLWENTNGISYDTQTNSLTKTAPNGWGNAGANTLNELPKNKDGYMTYTIHNLEPYRMFGFSNQNTDDQKNSIAYGFYISANQTINIMESGTTRKTVLVAIGDELTIKREGNNINYYINGVLYHTTATNPDQTLIGDIAINRTNTGFMNLKMGHFRGPAENYPYASLKRKLDGSYYITNGGQVQFKFDEEYNDNTLSYKVFNMVNTEVANQNDVPVAITYGDNLVSLDFSGFGNHCLKNGYYILETTNEKNEKRYLRFKQDKVICPYVFSKD